MHSIFLRITLFFLTTLVVLGGVYALQYQKLNNEYQQKLQTETQTLLLILRKSIPLDPQSRRIYLQEHGYSIAEPHSDFIRTLQPALSTIPKDYPDAIQDSLKEGRIRILKDENHLYVYLTKATPPLLILKTNVARQSFWNEILFGFILIALLLLYWLIIRSLLPLKTLIRSINHYGAEGIYLPIHTTQKDEIALVARALNNAMLKNQTLLEARRLFLRNIMHELKTPITVGKLALPFLKNNEEKSILERAFGRMENLIAELVRLEQITSGALSPHIQPCDPRILVEKAKNLLFLSDEVIETSYDGTFFYADCEVFVTVFKNLIDNALKYSSDHKVNIIQRQERIVFYNKGEPWPEGCTLETISEPFFHRHENSQSFGLGLYIIKSIVNAHNFNLDYRYAEGYHCFEIVYHAPPASLD